MAAVAVAVASTNGVGLKKSVGEKDGSNEGEAVGSNEGKTVGSKVGIKVGSKVGTKEGSTEGSTKTAKGVAAGASVGASSRLENLTKTFWVFWAEKEDGLEKRAKEKRRKTTTISA